MFRLNGQSDQNETMQAVLTRLDRAVAASNARIRKELDETETDVLQRLSQTNEDLTQAVGDAKKEINDQVDLVRSNMDQVGYLVARGARRKGSWGGSLSVSALFCLFDVRGGWSAE